MKSGFQWVSTQMLDFHLALLPSTKEMILFCKEGRRKYSTSPEVKVCLWGYPRYSLTRREWCKRLLGKETSKFVEETKMMLKVGIQGQWEGSRSCLVSGLHAHCCGCFRPFLLRASVSVGNRAWDVPVDTRVSYNDHTFYPSCYSVVINDTVIYYERWKCFENVLTSSGWIFFLAH